MSPRVLLSPLPVVAKMIKQLGDDKVKFKLALSLHAANDDKRTDNAG
jgi:23S rRNA (adenine2503-C2)-methyltransferase